MRALLVKVVGVALVLWWAACTAALAQASPRLFWNGDQTLSEESLFSQFREFRENQRFVSEPILEGEDLQALLVRFGIPEDEAAAAAQAFLTEAGLEALDEGTSVRVRFLKSPATLSEQASGRYPRALQALEVLVDLDRLVAVGRTQDGFEAASRPVAPEVRYVAAAGEINRSLFAAAQGAGVPREVMLRFADVFAFDVDFAREIFRGDRFEIVYEVFLNDQGEELAVGEIMFAALTWKGGIFAQGYYRHTPPGAEEPSYFSADGVNPRTLLMKTPINGARVTSRFGRRRHPVLGFDKGHAGIDFGAPTGTPVLAAGDGVVKLAGPRGTFGNYVRLEHSGGIETAYAHLKGFAPGLKEGQRVKQGEVIGYVGTTGRSTGPHLHYEVLQDNVPQNPETVKVAVGEALIDDALISFVGERDWYNELRIRPFAIGDARLP